MAKNSQTKKMIRIKSSEKSIERDGEEHKKIKRQRVDISRKAKREAIKKNKEKYGKSMSKLKENLQSLNDLKSEIVKLSEDQDLEFLNLQEIIRRIDTVIALFNDEIYDKLLK